VIAQQLQSVNLEASPDRAHLFSDLVNSFAELHGQEARLASLQTEEERLDNTLRVYTRESKELERLQREHELAQAVFTSAAARLESGKSDVFASYPVLQLLTAPNEPIQRKSPNMKIAMLSLVAGFLFITTALLIIWQRAYLVRKLLAKP